MATVSFSGSASFFCAGANTDCGGFDWARDTVDGKGVSPCLGVYPMFTGSCARAPFDFTFWGERGRRAARRPLADVEAAGTDDLAPRALGAGL